MNDTIFFCDFDGTVTVQDVTDTLLNELGPEDWTDIGEKYLAGEITHAEMNAAFAKMMPREKKDIYRVLDEKIEKRKGFDSFVDRLTVEGHALVIISGGWNTYITRVLRHLSLDIISDFSDFERYDFRSGCIPVVANDIEYDATQDDWNVQLTWSDRSCRLTSPCKEQFLLNKKGKFNKTVVVGNSESDICMSSVADVVYATGSLPRLLRERDIDFQKFTTFDEISV